MVKETLQVGDIVYANTGTMGRYIITNYVRGFIGIVLQTNRKEADEDILVLDLFCSGRMPLVFDLDEMLDESNPKSAPAIHFFKYALSNPTRPYDRPVPEFFIGSLHSFGVNSRYFSKLDVQFPKWKEHTLSCVSHAELEHRNHYERNKLDPDDLNQRLDTLHEVFSKYFFSMKPHIQPKLFL